MLIPKKDSEVERLQRQHDNELRALRADMEIMRNEQQRLRDEVGSVPRTHSTGPSAESFHSAEREARRAIPPDIFYDLPRRGEVNWDSITLSDLNSPKL